MTTGVKLLVITDLHLGTHSVPIHDLIKHLHTFIFESNIDYSQIDMFIIDGDVFDKALSLSNSNTIAIIEAINAILLHMHSNGIAVRILDGTNSHDFNQSRIFKILGDAMGSDLTYIDTVSIEDFKGYTIGYVPDNVVKPYQSIVSVMAEKGLSTVDMLHVHDAFRYNLPAPALTEHTLIEDDFTALVNKLVVNGHIHTPMVYNSKLRTLGSFDTYNHGEEVKKGGYIIELTENDYTIDFIENKNVTVFKSIDLTGDEYRTLTKARQYIKRTIKPFLRDDEHINVRLILKSTHPLAKVKTLPNITGKINWKYKVMREESPEMKETKLKEDIVVDKDNILHEIKQYADKHTDNKSIKELLSELQDVINHIGRI